MSQVLSSTQIALNKHFNFDDPNVWTPEPGPLKVKAINTGAGRLALKPEDGGVVIAEIQADLEGHGVSVQSHESLDIYQSDKSIQIAGSGFVDGIKVGQQSKRAGGAALLLSLRAFCCAVLCCALRVLLLMDMSLTSDGGPGTTTVVRAGRFVGALKGLV